MIEVVLPPEGQSGISQELVEKKLSSFVTMVKARAESKEGPRKVLLLPPDFTRFHSRAGEISSLLFDLMPPTGDWAVTDVMPALGTHAPMSEEQVRRLST